MFIFWRVEFGGWALTFFVVCGASTNTSHEHD
jgi:hypothetical protein